MILPLPKKPQTILPNTRLAISASGSFLLCCLAMASSIGTFFLSSATAGSAETNWSQASTPHGVAQHPSGERVASYRRKTVVRDWAVVAAVWEEDDAFVETAVETAQAVEDRSVVVRRSTAPRMPLRDRLAQLPEDPFEATDESLLELDIEDPPLEEVEEVEEALDHELDRREDEQELSEEDLFEEPDLFEERAIDEEPQEAEDDPFEEPLVEQFEEVMDEEFESPPSERDLFDMSLEGEDDLEPGNLSELFEEEMRKDRPDGEPASEPESEPDGESEKEKLDEREESERNCEEEIAKVRADRIDDIDLSILLEGDAGEDFPFECRLDSAEHQPRQWPQITYNWKAAALCHKPLYFEQVHLERYGHSWGPYVQPIMSGVHFFGTLPILPYKMGIRTPTECVYTLGYYRPGSCAPYLIDPIPFTWRAALFQAGAATALPFAIP